MSGCPGDVAGLGEAVLRAMESGGIGLVAVVHESGGPRVVYLNDAGLQIIGRTREDVGNRSFLDFLTPQTREVAMEISRRAIAGGEVTTRVDGVLVRPDGTEVTVGSFAARLTIDGKPGSVAFFSDVTDRRAMERQRLDEAQRFARVVEAAPDGIAIVRGPIILHVNAAGARMLGFDDPKAALGVSLADLMLPEEVPLMLRRMKASAEGKGSGSQVYRVRRKDGSIISAEVSSIPFEHEGKPALIAFVRDVTERAQLQEQMARAERLASLSTLAAGLAHEVNNPLTAAMLQVDVIETEARSALGGAPAPAVFDRLRQLKDTHERIAEVMRGFAAFARTGNDKRETVDLKAVLDAVERMLAPMIQKKGRYTNHVQQLPHVRAEASRIEQVFLNLLLNAVQALPDGREGNEITVRGRALGDGRVCIEIQDNGVGITTENLRRVFDPFFTTKPVGVGTGLGLTVCHNIVSSYGGEIEIDSVSGHGCTMRVLLPADDSVQPESGGRTRVMIVDDEPHLATTLRLLLEARHDVVATTQSEHAVRLLVEGAPVDVVLCDLMMPDPNGMELFRRVVERRPELEKRFIFMTGGVFTHATERFLATTTAPHVLKPFDPTQVEALIARVAAQG